MTHIEHMAFILGTPEKAWESLSDQSGYSKWMANLGQITKAGQGQASVGSSFEQRFKIVGKWNPAIRWQTTKAEAPKTLVFEGKGIGVASGTLTVSLEPVPMGTQLKVSADLKYPVYLKLIAWLALERLFLRRTMQTRLRRTIDAAKAILESRPPKVYA